MLRILLLRILQLIQARDKSCTHIFDSTVPDNVRGLVHFQLVAEATGARLPEGLHFQCDQRRGVPQGRGQAQTRPSRPLRLQVLLYITTVCVFSESRPN
jgi:hypothetical protein